MFLRLNLPVPPGFIITTAACREYYENGYEMTEHLLDLHRDAVYCIERDSHKKFGGVTDDKPSPLLLSVRAGSTVKMPGQFESILNVGINDSIVDAIAGPHNRYRHFAVDTQRRFLQMFGTIVLKADAGKYERILSHARERDGVDEDHKLSTDSLLYCIGEFKRIVDVPDDPYEQLRMAIEALFMQWNEDRVADYRQAHSIPASAGVAVTVQQMVFGNMNSRSGTGIAVAANALKGGDYHIRGAYVRKGEGVDAVDGSRESASIWDVDPEIYDQLERHFDTLQEHYNRDVQYVEFTVEDGKLYILETSAVKMQPTVTDEGFVYVIDAEDFR